MGHRAPRRRPPTSLVYVPTNIEVPSPLEEIKAAFVAGEIDLPTLEVEVDRALRGEPTRWSPLFGTPGMTTVMS